METKTNLIMNPLGTEKISKLILKFAIPAIASGLVSALYNIVDQIFIGNTVGIYGNGATNVAFPLTTISTALALLLGIGGASNFNLCQGRGEAEKAGRMAANAISYLAISGIILGISVLLFLKPLLVFFGATDNVMPFALTYTMITAFGLPCLIFSTGASQLIRADGSPAYAMVCVMAGAVLNIGLDALFMLVFHMGMAGAALATVIGQVLSLLLVLVRLLRFKNVSLKREYFRPQMAYGKAIAGLGAAACFNQLAMTVVQIAMNNTLKYYGGLSHYGSDIPIACVGVISKVNVILIAFVVGIAQGCQPINGYNYGAKNYGRVKKTLKLAIISASVFAVAAFLSFQLFPREIVSIFGQGSEDYFEFAERYLRIFMMMTFLFGLQPVTANFFTSIGKAQKGIFMSLTKQILFLLPLIVIFPVFMGIDGVMYAGPIADSAAAILAVVFIVKEMRAMSILEGGKKCQEPN